MDMPYTLDELKRLVAPVARKHGVKKVAVFGSYGRSQATGNSDIDLYIEKGRIRSLLEMLAFQRDMEETLNTRVDIVTGDIMDRDFLDRIRNDVEHDMQRYPQAESQMPRSVERAMKEKPANQLNQ